MKNIMSTSVASFLLLFAVASQACPTFNGTYVCKTDQQDKVVHLSTSTVGSVTHYKLEDSDVAADGVYRKVRYEGGDYDMAASCKDQELSLKVKFDGGGPGESACGAQKWNVLYILNWKPAGNNIAEHTAAATLCADGKEIPNDVSSDFTCVKQ